MDSQQGNSRDDAPNGELGVDAQQLGQIQAAGAEDQQGDAGSDGDQHSEQQEEADGEDQAAGESQAGQESSGAAAAQGPFSPDLRERVKDLEKLVRDIMAEKQTKPGGSHFQGVKLRPADPPKFSGANKEVVKDWLATVFQWLGSGNCVPTQRVPLAQTFLTGGAATLWRAKSAVLQSQGFDILDWDVFARTLETAFGHQDPEQNARDKLDVLKQTHTVEDYANKFQSLVAEIVTMPPSEGDLLQKFRNGLKPEMQIAAGIDPITGTRWMDLQKFISYACVTDASRIQANRGSKTSDKSEQGKSSGSGTSYKEKLKGKRPNESSSGQPPKKPKMDQEKKKQSDDQKAKDWEQNTCFYCHKPDHKARDCPDKPKRAGFQKTK